MKNNLLIFFFLFLISSSVSIADEFRFETSEIKLIDGGKLVYAKNGLAISSNNNIEINAENFEYNKETQKLKATKGIILFKSENLEIEFGELSHNQLSLITIAENGVKIIDKNKKFFVTTDSVIFNKKNNILKSESKSTLKDELKNELQAESFLYDINDGILKLKNTNLKDLNGNNFNMEFAFLNTNTKQLIGNDIVVNLNNKSFDKDNEPRIKGKTLVYDNEKTEITKGVFTTCKKTDKCPPWQLSAEKIVHNPKKQIINYKNAILKVYDIPVMYFPKFFHPDPTVDRKSGFLIPTIKNSPNSTSFLSVPYFSAISQNKDMTFTPRFYSNDNFLLQSEYRQENKDSSHITDVSFYSEKDKDSKTHFFYKYTKLIDLVNFDDVNLNLKVEKTSNDTYLRKNNLSSPLINNYNTLENYLTFDLYSANLSINSELKVFENLDKDSSDRYEFILPKVDIIKRIENKTALNGNFLIKSNNFIRSYATNILEKVNINNFIFNSNPKISNQGFFNNYDFIVKNVNSNTQKSSSYQEDENFYLSGIFQYNSSLPLIKEKNGYINLIKPKMALKISPNYTKDLSKSDGNRLDVNNVFNIDRLSADDTIEGGISLTLGNDFIITDKIKSNEILAIKFANNLRLEENDDLPKNNQIGAKTSNFFGEISYSPNKLFTAKYNSSSRNNLTDINYENFIAEISINNFVTTFDYLNENYSSDKSSYLTNTTKYSFNNSNSIKFSTRENKSSNLTEYYNLIYEYKNDCLAASIEYDKDYYDDRDIKPEENIFFKLTIIPFGETSSPNLKN